MKKSQCPPVFKTIRNKNQKTKNTTALEKTWIVDAYHYENNQQQKLEEKNKQAEKNPFHHFWICWKTIIIILYSLNQRNL
jgi:hypothetical protein